MQRLRSLFLTHVPGVMNHGTDRGGYQGRGPRDQHRAWAPGDRDGGAAGGIQTRTVRLKFPEYSGGDPLDWLHQAEMFFDYHGTPPHQQVQLASFHLQQEASRWFRTANRARPFVGWTDFATAMCTRFGPSEFEDFQEALTQIYQQTTVRAYQAEFERLTDRIEGWTDSQLRSLFIGGLKMEVRAEVKILRPATLHEAFTSALMVEEKLKGVRGYYRSWGATAEGRASRSGALAGSGAAGPNSRPRAAAKPGNSRPSNFRPNAQGRRRLSAAEVAERRAKGLCFWCEEKFVPGHKCKQQPAAIMLLEAEEEDEETVEDVEETEMAEEEIHAELSLHAYSGARAPRTLRVEGLVKKTRVKILIDSGSTHNFMEHKLVRQLGLAVSPTVGFDVAIGDGTTLRAGGRCDAVKVTIQGHEFELDVYPLALKGADLVLGVQWMQGLGPITMDLGALWMEFVVGGKVIRLDGVEPETPPTFHALDDLPRAGCHGLLMMVAGPTPGPTTGEELPADLTQLLRAYPQVFEEPQGLPPARPHDHRIDIVPGAEPANVRPYRYPHMQKEAITKMVKEMLEQGIIQPSHSAYSSPVLLVRKKDGSWRFCVDYRALNAITIKDRYPIPVIEELLDELAGATIFTKLDLRAGYHQIRVRAEDVHKTAFRTHDGHYEFLVMPFGLTNAPSTFQGLMNDVFRPLLRRYVLVFFDDILIYSRTREEHLSHLRTVLETLASHGLRVKMNKCTWAQPRVSYLGHCISAAGVEADPDKIEAMQAWPKPANPKALRGFLGLTGYYRRFIQGYGQIAAPLTAMLKKNNFQWTDKAESAFAELKKAMISPPVLALPDFSKTFVVECDASARASVLS